MSAKRIEELLKPLFEAEDKEMLPADEEAIGHFRREAEKLSVPEEVIGQLEEYYRVTKGEEYLDGYYMHECEDMILFEWWEEDGALWLGGRNDDVYRWIDGRFCLGDASNDSYGEAYEFPTLAGLIEKIVEEIREARN